MTSKHGMLMVCSMVEMKKSQNHHSTDKQYFQWKSWIFIEDTNGKKTIFRNLDFPHIKSIFKKWVKNTSLFVVLAFKILDTEKVTFLKGVKKCFFVSRLFSRGPMALKTCGKDALENSCLFHKNKILIK